MAHLGGIAAHYVVVPTYRPECPPTSAIQPGLARKQEINKERIQEKEENRRGSKEAVK
jgi:hypothetical protein